MRSLGLKPKRSHLQCSDEAQTLTPFTAQVSQRGVDDRERNARAIM